VATETMVATVMVKGMVTADIPSLTLNHSTEAAVPVMEVVMAVTTMAMAITTVAMDTVKNQ